MAARRKTKPLVCNGIDGATGAYWLGGLTPDDLARVAKSETLNDPELAALKARYEASQKTYLGTIEGVDPADLGQAGWGVIFAHDASAELRDALEPLLSHRQTQTGERYREFFGPDGVRPGESSRRFLVRHKAAPGSPANPDSIPYYLLLVGEPKSITYQFQYQLDVTYAVGRIAFDTIDEYARYAESVVAAETRRPRAQGIALFGTRNPDDQATMMSADRLVEPLGRWLAKHHPKQLRSDAIAGDATTERFRSLLGGGETPSLLFSATHGMAFPRGHELQLKHQGAILCQDWPGPVEWQAAIPQDFYFSGDDLLDTANPAGMVAFFFACYGAGSPQFDDFAQQAGLAAKIAPHPFLGWLPRRLLGHPRGSALAVIGHVDRAWSYSFNWPRAGEQLDVFKSTLGAMIKGDPIGLALEYFNNRYGALASELTDAQRDARFEAVLDPNELAGVWTGMVDARNYVILGDPAVRLM
jgi:hypothetical protein